MADDSFTCEACEVTVAFEAALRRETRGGLDPEAWRTIRCPYRGSRLRTVFVGDR